MFLNINKSKSNNIWYIVDNSNLNWGIKTERDDCLCKKIRTTHNFLNKYFNYIMITIPTYWNGMLPILLMERDAYIKFWPRKQVCACNAFYKHDNALHWEMASFKYPLLFRCRCPVGPSSLLSFRPVRGAGTDVKEKRTYMYVRPGTRRVKQ